MGTAAGTVSERIRAALDAHDADALQACFHAGYRSEQPAHPDRAFTGSDQVHANWSAIFAGVPDLRAELLRVAAAGGEEWSEWHMHGTRRDGSAFSMRGVIINGVEDGRVAWARLYLEPEEVAGAGIEAAVDRHARG